MTKILFIFILLSIFSCNESKIKNTKKIDYVNVNDEGDADESKKISDETQEIGYLYQPEIMRQEEIKKTNGKNDYQYTLSNSDLLDNDLSNLKKHSKIIVTKYYKFLIRINIPFNYDKIIVKIIHRNGKVDTFEYSENDMQKIINKQPSANSVYDEIAGFQAKECLFLLSLSPVAENTLLLFSQLRIHAKRYQIWSSRIKTLNSNQIQDGGINYYANLRYSAQGLSSKKTKFLLWLSARKC